MSNSTNEEKRQPASNSVPIGTTSHATDDRKKSQDNYSEVHDAEDVDSQHANETLSHRSHNDRA
jgi:hypothetical protein